MPVDFVARPAIESQSHDSGFVAGGVDTQQHAKGFGLLPHCLKVTHGRTNAFESWRFRGDEANGLPWPECSELGGVQVRVREGGSLNNRAAQICSGQVCPGQIRAGQIRVCEVRSREACVGKHGPTKGPASEIASIQISPNSG